MATARPVRDWASVAVVMADAELDFHGSCATMASGCPLARTVSGKLGSTRPHKYDTRFRRMWEYYLSCGIAAAAVSDSAVYQILFTNDATLELPLARV